MGPFRAGGAYLQLHADLLLFEHGLAFRIRGRALCTPSHIGRQSHLRYPPTQLSLDIRAHMMNFLVVMGMESQLRHAATMSRISMLPPLIAFPRIPACPHAPHAHEHERGPEFAHTARPSQHEGTDDLVAAHGHDDGAERYRDGMSF